MSLFPTNHPSDLYWLRNMAAAIIGGLRSLNYPAALIRVCGPDTDQLDELNSRYGVGISADNTTFL